jgi:hypothetical protein
MHTIETELVRPDTERLDEIYEMEAFTERHIDTDCEHWHELMVGGAREVYGYQK